MIELSEICATRHNNAQGPDGNSGTYCQIVDPLVTARNLKKAGRELGQHRRHPGRAQGDAVRGAQAGLLPALKVPLDCRGWVM
jgi:hypothetical protein